MIPFCFDGHTDRADLNNRNRLRLYRKFIGRSEIGGHSLDIGTPGYISKSLRVRHSTWPGDFNNYILSPAIDYDVITNFEVINHLMNPLKHLDQCLGLLAPGGVMYLSHPRAFLIAWPHCRFDFVDYEVSRFKQMVEYAGFEVVRHETHNPWPLRFMFYGFRPILRVLFNRIEIWELRKP